MEIKKQFYSLMIIGLTSCVTPSQRFDESANDLGLYEQRIRTNQFQHKIYLSKKKVSGKALHVYLDGDGTPWERNRWVANDPTARNPLILRLMIQDTAPSILLGRPCYYGLNEDIECDNKYWTSHRYSKEVVNSMSSALNIWLLNNQFEEIILIGYSGGGSLAVLIADKIEKVKKIVTVAANLNVQAWSEFHGYQTLTNSLDPAKQEAFDEQIAQLHFAGEDDTVVPPFVIKEYSERQKGAKYYVIPNNDHRCCWEAEWKEILNIIE